MHISSQTKVCNLHRNYHHQLKRFWPQDHDEYTKKKNENCRSTSALACNVSLRADSQLAPGKLSNPW